MKKTFKIGEEAIGGIITVSTVSKGAFKVECKDYYTKEVVRWRYAYNFRDLVNYLEECSTHYHADRISKFFADDK